jgi:hypothetical protein
LPFVNVLRSISTILVPEYLYNHHYSLGTFLALLLRTCSRGEIGMQILKPEELLLIIVSIIFVLGLFTFGAGVFVLLARALGSETRTIAKQTSRLAQKGITDDIAGLVGNVSALVEATNQLIRTAAGIGIFLTVLGLGLMSLSIWIAFYFGLWS